MPSGRMSPRVVVAADGTACIAPRRPPGQAGLGSQACPKADAVVRLWVAAQAETPGAGALGCEIKEEASAKGRRRGTFAAKGTRTRRPSVFGHALFPCCKEESIKALLQEGFSISGSANTAARRTHSRSNSGSTHGRT